jgi:hypothetical protein
MPSSLWTAGLIAIAVLAPSAVRAEQRSVFAKAGAKVAEVTRDEADCRALAANTFYLMPAVLPSQGGLIGVAILAAMTPSYNAESRSRSLAICMRHRGYGRVVLTQDEASAFGAQRTDAARDAWMGAFLSGDIGARVAAALTPAAPMLPTAEDAHDPFVIGAARLDPKTFALAPMLEAEGDVVTGKLTRRRTAVLKEDYSDSIALSRFKAAAGTVFQEYLEPLPWDPSLSEDRTAWCAPLTGVAHYLTCVRSTLAGYEFAISTGETWLAGYAQGENAYKRPFLKPIALAVQSADSQEPIEFRLAITHVSSDAVVLKARALKGKETVEFWTGTVKFDPSGQARLPFWDRTLVLSRSGPAIKAAFEPRSDGKGWGD